MSLLDATASEPIRRAVVGGARGGKAGARLRRVVESGVPKVCALGLLVGVWQLVVSLRLQPSFVVPAPADVAASLVEQWRDGHVVTTVSTSLRRGAVGYLAALGIGTPLGLLIARLRAVRLGVGSLVAGLQSLPSVTWVPVGIVWFGLTETTVTFVVVMGAFPSIAQGIVSAIDQMPPQLLRVGRSLGAGGLSLYRHVILPAALPGYIAGMKQAWSFSWRSLMAAELITQSPDLGLGLGQLLDNARQLNDMTLVVAAILLILAVGVAVDGLVFGPLDRAVRARRGLDTV